MISHLQCVLDCNLRGKIGKNLMWGERCKIDSSGNWTLLLLCPPLRLCVCLDLWVSLTCWHPFPPSPKKTKEGRDWGECHPFLFLKAWRYSVFRCIPTIYWAGQKNSFGLSYGKIQMNILANPIVWLLACREIPELPACLCCLGAGGVTM